MLSNEVEILVDLFKPYDAGMRLMLTAAVMREISRWQAAERTKDEAREVVSHALELSIDADVGPKFMETVEAIADSVRTSHTEKAVQ